MEVNGYCQLSGFQHCLKYILLSTKERNYFSLERFGTWRGV